MYMHHALTQQYTQHTRHTQTHHTYKHLGDHGELRGFGHVDDVRVLLVDGVALRLDFHGVLEDSERVVERALLVCAQETAAATRTAKSNSLRS